jgi:hypothetical protein
LLHLHYRTVVQVYTWARYFTIQQAPLLFASAGKSTKKGATSQGAKANANILRPGQNSMVIAIGTGIHLWGARIHTGSPGNEYPKEEVCILPLA